MSPPIVLHIPHASAFIPAAERSSFPLSDDELDLELLRMTDWYTDEVFGGLAPLEQRVEFPVSRLVLDPERFEDDEHETMAQVGMGVLYTTTSHGEPLRPPLPEEERRRLLDLYYRPHHARLTDAVARQLDRSGKALVIDCHSFPSAPLPYEKYQGTDRPEICIGTDDYHTPGWLADAVVEAFEAEGFTVDVDRPFSGALVPSLYYRASQEVAAFMIEVRRDLYMDEVTGDRLGVFSEVAERVRACVLRATDSFGPPRSDRPAALYRGFSTSQAETGMAGRPAREKPDE